MATPNKSYYLVADIGGTNTRVALAQGREVMRATIKRYSNAENDGLTPVLTDYCAQHDAQIDAACVAIAGPVRDGRAEMTNLDWAIDHKTLETATGATRTAILNDLQAQGHAIGHVSDSNLNTILAGNDHAENSTALVVGLGTGVNVAPVFNVGNQRYVPPAEAGHISLPISHPDDAELAKMLTRDHGFAAAEDALSGRGLEHIYAFRCEKISGATPIKAAEIMARMKAQNDTLAVESVQQYVRILGAYCGDMALLHLPFDGIYFVGGVSRAVIPYLVQFGFEEAFRAKGRFNEFLSQFPVKAINDDYAALTGCAAHLNRHVD